MSEEAEFRCDQCGKAFGSRPSLSGHTRRAHGRRSRARRVGTKGGSTPAFSCPTCGQGLPPAARVVAEDFAGEGIDEELAAKLAAKAWALLTVPGS